MIKTIKRPISILLAVLMVIGMFTVLPISAGAAPPDSGSSGSDVSGSTDTDINAATWTFKLNSNFSGQWNDATDVVSEQPVELTLAAGDYEFQIVAYKNGTLNSYRGNEQAGSSTDTYSQIMYDNGGNAKFHANGGKYTLTYNAGTGVVNITKTAAGLSTWAEVKAAATNGGSYVLLNDIYYCETAFDAFDDALAIVANDLSIDGNGYGFKAKDLNGGNGYRDALFKVNANKKLSLSNMNYDGTDGYNGSNLVGVVFDALVIAGDGANVSLTDVTATALRGENAVVLNGASTADITRCAFNNTYLDGDDIKIDSAASVTLDDTDATVGTVDGYKVVNNNGTYTAAPVVYVAEDVATGNKYETVNDAVKAAGENGEVKLIADINIAAGELNVGIDGDYTTTLDLNGHTINNAAGSGITLYSKYPGGKTFTIKDTSENQTGAITINKKYPGDGCISDSSGRKVVIEGGTYTSDANALYVSSDEGWTIKGGTFNGNIKVVSGLDIQGGTINGNINATGPSWTVDPAEVTISGGTVNGSLNSENGSTFEVSGGTFTDDVSEYTTVDTYQNANGEVVPKAANTIYDDGDFAKAAAEGGNWYIVADVNAAGVTVTSDLKVWNTDKTHTITGDFTVADNTAFATAGKKTTNINGDITLAGQDSKVSSTRANKVILTQPYKTGQVYGVPAATKVIYDGKEIVFDSISLTNAASKGGEFYVVDDFTMNAAVSPSKNLSLVGLKADGSRPTITVASTSTTRTAFNLFNPTNGTDLSIEKINFAATKTDEKVIGVVNTNTASSADKYSTITIKDSKISGFSVADNYGAVYLHGYSHATLTNVEMSGNGKYDVWAGAAADVTISDGSYESVYLNGGVAKATVADGAAITEIVAAEGTTIAADSYTNVNVGDGYKLVDNGDGSKTVVAKNYVAEVNGVKYETLQAAIDAAQTGDTITLLDDIALTGANWFVVDNKDLTIDLGGKNISSEDSVFVLKNGADLTVKNGTMTTSVSGDYAIYVNNESVFTLNNDATLKATNSNGNGIIVRDGGKAVINGTVESGYYSIAGFGSAVVDVNAGASITSTNASALSGNGSNGNEGYTFNINGGTLTSVNDVAIYHPNQGTLNIIGGTITGATAIYVKSGTTDISTSTTSISGATITGNGAAKELVHSGNGCNPTGDAIVIENCGYPGGTPAIDISGGTIVSKNADPVHSYGYNDYEPIEKFVSGGTFSKSVPAAYCADGYDPKDNGDGTYTVTPHEHDWDYENVTWNFTENETSHSIYAKYTLTCKTDPTHTKEQTGSGTLMVTVAVDGDKFVYSHAAVKIDGNSVAVPNYTRNVADGIINRSELVAASKVAGEYKLANDITGFYDSVKPVDGFVLDGQNNMIKYGTMNASNRVMFVAADQNTKFTLKNITLDGNNKAKWAVCAYTGNSGNNAGNVITLDTVTIQNFKSNDYVGAINAFGSSTWNLKDCTITGNTTTDDSDGLSGSAVWAGSKATINIDGGTYDEVYLHSYSGTGAVLNADGGATINNLVLDLTKTDTLKANIDDATVGAITANDGFIPEEAVVMDPTKATVAAPEGYQWIDSEETGMKTLGHIHDYTSSFNWTQSAEGADWDCNKLTLTCACGDVQTYPVTGFFGTSAVTVTANNDGSFTYSVSKTVDGETYSDTKTVAAEGHIKTNKQLTAAAKKGGEWQLDNDLNGVVNVVCADGFVLNGQGYKVTRNSGVDTNPVFRINSNPAEVTLKNLIIDGIEGRSNTKAAIATKQSNPSAGNVLNLENVHIENYDISATNNGAVLAWGQATVNLTDCTVNTESTYDVWAGAAATVNINSGSFGDVYLNGGTSKATVDDGAIVSTVTYGASAQSQVAVEDGTVRNIALAEGVELAKENFIAKTPETALVNVPAGYMWVDSQTTGMKTLDKAQDVFVGHTITLNGNINLNFYINTNAIPGYANASSVKATFTWDSKAIASDNHYGDDVVVVELKDLTPNANGWVKAYVPVNAAQMANQIEAKVYVGDGEALAETDTYSVMQYAKELLAGNYTDAQKTLVKKMLNYGAMAQKVFESQLVDSPDVSANSVLSENDRTAIANEMNGVNADMIIDAIMRANGDKRGATVRELQEIGERIGGKWYTTSVIFLDGNTIRHYFDDVNEGVMNHAGAAGVQDTWFYYVEKKDIAASQLDTLYTFTIGGQSFQYSVLDYAAAVLESNMGDDAENLAKALYLYNQAANAYFVGN